MRPCRNGRGFRRPLYFFRRGAVQAGGSQGKSWLMVPTDFLAIGLYRTDCTAEGSHRPDSAARATQRSFATPRICLIFSRLIISRGERLLRSSHAMKSFGFTWYSAFGSKTCTRIGRKPSVTTLPAFNFTAWATASNSEEAFTSRSEER